MNALAVSEDALFFERSLDLLAVVGLDGYFRRVNPMFTQALGYAEAEFLSHPFLDFVHSDDHSATLAEMEKLNSGVPTFYFENRYRTKDGSYRWFAWTASPQIEQGAIYCVARDVTKQKQTEWERRELESALQQANQELEQRVAERTAQLEDVNAALQESEERNQLAMEVAQMFSFEWEPSTNVVKRSPHCGCILGLEGVSAELDTGTNFFQRVHPEDRDRFVAGIQALTPENSTYQTTYRVVRPDGQIVVLEESGRALFDSRRQLIRLIGMTADVTERHRLETQLEESRATLQQQLAEIETIYQSAPIGLNVLDTDLRFVRINQQLAEINGISAEEHLGKTIRELLPDLADTAEHLLRPILETGEPLLNVELRGETPAQPGVQRVWLEHFLPLKDGDRVIGINTVCEEITERKKTEEALRQFNLLIELSYEPILVWDLDRGIIQWNRGCEQLYGYTREVAIGQNSHSLLQTVYPIPLSEVIKILKRDGQWAGELKHTTRTGNQVIVESRQQLIETSGQNLVLETNRDVTAYKQAEQRLRESEERLRMAIASAQLGTWDWNLVTGELQWNAACKAMFGLPPDTEVSIDMFFEGLHPDDRDRLQETIQVALNPVSGGAYDTEYRTIGIQDNVERWLRAKGQVYYDAHGKPLRFSGTALDITKQKQAEAQREQLFQQEQAAREAAERANRIKDEFLAVLSHELRTPLNPILGWSQLLQSSPSPEKLQQGLSTIERNAKQQAKLIEDLLDISRIIRGKLALNFAEINLAEPITAALETVRLAAEAKSIRLEVLLDRSIGRVKGDAGRLQQMVWNLLSNAIKFTPANGQVTVQLTQVDHKAQIQVSDTGKGIQPEFLPYVFDLFQQQDSSTTRAFGGLGLGLAIARQVAEAHGGTITVTSAGEGQGATFTVKLPLIPVQRPDEPIELKQPTPGCKNLRVIVVDDEVDSLELIQVLLEQEGAIVQAVSSATAALRLLTQGRFDLLISDIGMPEMDGYALIRQIRVLPPQFNRDIVAIALTAYAGEINQHQILAAGFQAHLAKPIEPSRLLDAIAMLIKP